MNGRWIGNDGLRFMDGNNYTRAALIYENRIGWLLIGPIGCVGQGMEIKERHGKNKKALQKLIEKELRDAGY